MAVSRPKFTTNLPGPTRESPPVPDSEQILQTLDPPHVAGTVELRETMPQITRINKIDYRTFRDFAWPAELPDFGRFFISSERRFLPAALMRRRLRLAAGPPRRPVKLPALFNDSIAVMALSIRMRSARSSEVSIDVVFLNYIVTVGLEQMNPFFIEHSLRDKSFCQSPE